MSGNHHGFWLCTPTGRHFVPVEDREDLDGEKAQSALSRARSGGAVLVCGCDGQSHGRPFLATRQRSFSSSLSCVRERIDDHGPSCVFTHIYGQAEGLKLSHEVFADQSESLARVPTGAGASVPLAKARSITYHHLVSQLVSEAVFVAFCSNNPRPPFLCQPTIRHFAEAWMPVLKAKRFANDSNAIAAAGAYGVRIALGFIFSELPPPALGDAILPVFWMTADGLLSAVNVVGGNVLSQGVRSVTGRQGVIPPPYLVVATLRHDGRINHIWLRAVWTDGAIFFTIESDSERRFFGRIAEFGASVIYRPTLRRELDRLTTHLRLPRLIRWAHRPDALAFFRADLPVICELRGYRPGVFDDYDDNFADGQASYRQLADLFRTRVINLWELTEVRTPIGRDSWVFQNSAFGGVSSAAAAHVEKAASELVESEVAR